MPLYKLGKRPARKGAIKMAFGQFVDRSALPTPPARFGHERITGPDGKPIPWGMLSNDQHSNCVFAGAAHEHMVWTHEGGNPAAPFDDARVLADYSAVTGYDPADPDTDNGTDMAQAAAYRRKVGVMDSHGVRHKVDAYVSLTSGGLDDLLLATWLTGACGVGLMLPKGSDEQFDAQEPWTVQAGAGTIGGHYVPCIGRNSAGNLLVVTWGRIHAMTPQFFAHYSDESVAYISLEAIRDKTTPEGFDEPTLRSHLAKLASHPHA